MVGTSFLYLSYHNLVMISREILYDSPPFSRRICLEAGHFHQEIVLNRRFCWGGFSNLRQPLPSDCPTPT
jgi:hypothetical protein